MTRIGSVFAAIAIGTVLISAGPAATSDFCANRAEMIKSLAEQFKENPAAIGIIGGQAVVEVFVSKNGSFTILATGTDGRSCVLSAGEGWEINVAALGDGA